MATRTLAVISQKGGTGKTTVAFNIAAGLSLRGVTQLVDADPQGSLSQWSAVGFEKPASSRVIQIGDDVALCIEGLAGVCDYVVVDCPPDARNSRVRTLLHLAQLVLMPVLPSALDVWSSVDMLSVLDEVREINRDLRGYVLLNQLEPRNAMSRVMRDALRELRMPVLGAGIYRRAAFRTAAVEGVNVYQMGRRGEAAVRDVEAVIEEIL